MYSKICKEEAEVGSPLLVKLNMVMDTRRKHLMRLALASLLLMVLALASCEEKEKDLVPHGTHHLSYVEGVAQTSKGEPLVSLPVKLYYKEGNLFFSKTRLKAEGRTDKTGRYSLRFAVREDERESILFSRDKGHLPGYYTIEIETKGLGREYIMRDEYPGHPPKGYSSWMADVPWEDGDSKTYQLDFFLPKKRLVKVVLKGFESQREGDSFTFWHQLPAGFTILPQLPYTPLTHIDGERGKPGATAGEKIFEVYCALDQVNTFKLERVQAGVMTHTEHQLLITADSPEELVFVY